MNTAAENPPKIDFEAIAAEDDAHFAEFKIHWADSALLFIFFALFSTVFLQFFTRYVLNDSLSWTEEAARYLLIILSFAGAIRCQTKGSHIVLEFVDKYYGAKLNIIHVVAQLLILTILITLALSAYELIQRTSFQHMLSLPFPKYYLHAITLSMLSLNILVALQQLYSRLKQLKSKS